MKAHQHYGHYEHEYFYFSGLNHLAKNDLSGAIRKFKLVAQKCSEITAGKTSLRAAHLLIMLRLLTDKKIDFSHLNPEISQHINSQPEEILLILNPERDPAKRLKVIYQKKVLKIIKDFNTKGYRHYRDVECLKYNPYQKMDDWITDFFELYDDQTLFLGTEVEKLESIIKTLMKGRNAKYPINKPVVAIFQYTALAVLENRFEVYINSHESKVCSRAMQRLLNSPADFIDLLTGTLQQLSANRTLHVKNS